MNTELRGEIEAAIAEIAEAERKLYDDAPGAIGRNMKRYLKLKEKYNKLLQRYYSE